MKKQSAKVIAVAVDRKPTIVLSLLSAVGLVVSFVLSLLV